MRHWAIANQIGNVLKVFLDLVEIDFSRSLFQLQVELLEHLFILDGTLVQLLLNTNLTDSSVSYIIKLGQQNIVDVSACVILHQ